MLGRRRHLPNLLLNGQSSKDFQIRSLIAMEKRKSINTPMQGSGADIVTCAMIRLARDERLKQLGWKLLLQIHDEVILEGPEGSSNEAQRIVVECMEKPFYNEIKKQYWNPMRVELKVDSNIVDSWYDNK
eukprot:TRINITY_DN7068_c0_g1_i1.p4 TRINITY_DN7068_c0_g1~~TRINITY_DN7068_c0_g1_i1.p4  ORF type:complete len:130 (-),score=14.14 TRINITY_DN7068_c0_g1_i1:100-489(-)